MPAVLPVRPEWYYTGCFEARAALDQRRGPAEGCTPFSLLATSRNPLAKCATFTANHGVTVYMIKRSLMSSPRNRGEKVLTTLDVRAIRPAP